MWADVERFGIDALLAADAGAAETAGPAARRRTFAVQVPELASVDVHWHDYYELGYVLDGRATHVVNGRTETAAPGSVFLLSPADLHSLDPTGPSGIRVMNAVLHPDLVESTLEAAASIEDVGLPWSVPSLPGADADAHRIVTEVATRRTGWEVVVESALRALVVGLARAAAEVARPAGGPARGGPPDHLRRAVRHVERHFREPLSLEEVAAVAHLSPHWFSGQFRRATGQTFQQFLKERRLRFARALLESTGLGVTEACHAAGFNDPSYFGRAYRERYGIAPSRTPRARGRTAEDPNRCGMVP